MLTDWSGNGSGADDGYVIPFGYTVQYVILYLLDKSSPAWNASGALLAANQFVMATGIWNPFQRTLDISTLKRKLYNGDSIVLTVTNLESPVVDVRVHGVITYAIKYN